MTADHRKGLEAKVSSIALTRIAGPLAGNGLSGMRGSLSELYASEACRLMIYLCMTLLGGLATLAGLACYALLFQAEGSPASFRGVYAWATALNFGLCHLVVDEGGYRLGARWAILRRRSLPMLALWWGLAFCCFMVVQRSLVYAHTATYHPIILRYYALYPEARPGWAEMSLFCLPFWIAIAAAMVVLGFKVQRHLLPAVAPPSRRAAPDPAPVEAGDTLWVGRGGNRTALCVKRISHVAVEDHYCRFFLEEGSGDKEVLVLMSLKEVVARLPAGAFLQIHRSHVVRLGAVSGLEREGRRSWVRLGAGDLRLPVSRGRLAAVEAALGKYFRAEPG